MIPLRTSKPAHKGYSRLFVSRFRTTQLRQACLIIGAVFPILACAADPTQVIEWGGGCSFYQYTPRPDTLSNAVSVTAGSCFGLALKSNGTVVAWGYDHYGQTSLPAELTNVVRLAAGAAHSIALRSDGAVIAWGAGSPDRRTPYDYGQSTVPANLTNATVIGAGHHHSLAFTSDGRVVCWGDNSSGQTNAPVGLSDVIALAGGGGHSLALKSDGSVVAWGANDYGQTNVPVGLTGVVAIAAGAYHSLALRRDGTVVAWGAGLTNTGYYPFVGQASVPVDLSNVVAIAAGQYYSLALKADGTVAEWGGTSSSAPYTAPFGLTNVVAISAFANNLVLVGGGSPQILSAPENSAVYSGQHKSYNPQVAGLPPLSCQWRFNGTDIPGETNSSLSLTDPAEIKAGVYTLIVTNAYGLAERSMTLQVSNSPPLINQQPASLVVGERWDPRFSVWAEGSQPLYYQWRCNGTNIPGAGWMSLTVSNVQVAQAGDYDVVISNQFGITLSSNAALRVLPVCVAAWGSKDDGQTYVPPGLTNAVAVSAGDDHALALMRDGTVVAWGRNTYDNYSKTNVPATSRRIAAIAAGADFSLALLQNDPPQLGALLENPRLTDSTFKIDISTRNNRVYGLEYRLPQIDDDWTALPLAPGLGGLQMLSDPTATNSGRFYRVRQW